MTSGTADLAGVRVGRDRPVAVVGVLNVSPESFYPGSVHRAEALLEAARAMVEAGAVAVDVGARSTAPYLAGDITVHEERERLVAAVAALAAKLPVPVSVDTTRATVARAALDAGARIINDVSGLRDPGLASLAAERGVSLILMASPPGPTAGGEPVAVVRTLLAAALERARQAGVPEGRVVLDPGIGFFREAAMPWHEWDVAVLVRLDELTGLGRPLCVGLSRKSFIGQLTGHAAPADRLAGSLAATAVAVLRGAAVVRTHDVGETRDAVRVAERFLAARGQG